MVTGASGNIGGEIAKLLTEAGNPVRLFVRDAERAPRLAGAEIAVGDFREPRSIGAAIGAGDRLFMVSVHAPNPERVEIHRALIDHAARAGIAHIVYLSFAAASEQAVNYHARSHGTTELLLRRSGIDWTFLRPTLYMEVLPHRFDAAHVMRAPAGDGRGNWVSRSDIAAVAAAVLAGNGHAGQAYAVTGPESLTMRETAAVVSSALGRDFRYVDETREEGWTWRRGLGQEDWAIEARLASWESVRVGEVDVVSDVVRQVGGIEPTTLEEHVRANADEYLELGERSST